MKITQGPQKGFNQDQLNQWFLKGLATLVIALSFLLIILLFKQSLPVLKLSGFSFFTSDYWSPLNDQFGALAFFYGSVITAALAIFLATPLSLACALFINEILPTRLGQLVGFFVEMIAAIPSIVFGLWGVFYLIPWVRTTLGPFLKSYLGFLSFFQGPNFGIGILSASLILCMMIIPTITSLCREIFKSTPSHHKEAALSLGATRWEMIYLALLQPHFSGIVGGVLLGLGRALGETMAVAMVIGNQAQIKSSLFAPASTMASVIANEYAEAESDLHISALCLVALALFMVTLISNALARVVVWHYDQKRGINQ